MNINTYIKKKVKSNVVLLSFREYRTKLCITYTCVRIKDHAKM